MSGYISVAVLAVLSQTPSPKVRARSRAIALVLLSLAAGIHFAAAQTLEALPSLATPVAASSATVVPMLVRYDGAAIQGDGRPKVGTSPVTFLVYKDEQGGEALWTETQSVVFDQSGKYEVYLGSTRSSGLPADLFGSGEARWLEIQVTGESTRPRTLLVSVPYAIHAADAATLGGLPASAFMLAGTQASTSLIPRVITDASAPSTVTTTTGGTRGNIPLFTSTNNIENSNLFDNATGLGIGRNPSQMLDVNGNSVFRGFMQVSRTNDATPTTDSNSYPIQFNLQVYNTVNKIALNPFFTFQAESTGNNTSTTGATLNLTYYNGIGPSKGAETGLYFNHDGTIHFAPGQIFPSTSSTGNGLTGVSTSGIGVQGTSTAGTGVQGVSSSSYGVEGTSTTGPGVLGYTAGSTLNTGGVIGQAGATSGFGGIAGVSGDAYSHVGVLGTSNQYAGVQGLSSTGQGVQGVSTSSSGVQGTSTSGTGVAGTSTSADGVPGYTSGGTLNTGGVVGQAAGTSGFSGIAGVWGDTSTHVGVYGTSAQAAGVLGSSTNGPGVQGTSTNSIAGLFSNSSSSATVNATNTASNGGSALYGIAQGSYGIAMYASETGTAGTGVEAFGNGNGVIGDTSGGVLNTAGVLGIAGSRTGVGGIAGVWGDAQEHVGVIGSSKDYAGVYAASTNSYGVQALSTGASAGVYGVGGSTAVNSFGGFFGTGPIGVWGDVSGSTNEESVAIAGTGSKGDAAQFFNDSDTDPTVYAHNDAGGGNTNVVFRTLEASTPNGSCGFGGNGDLTCTGQMKSLATTGNGASTVETYSMQSPENWMEDFGSGTLHNGTATVSLDAAFAETVSGNADYHVFLTPSGDSKGLYVFAKTATSFEVRESGGGTSSLSFDYRVVAKRRGFESQRMVDVTDAMKAVKARDEVRAARLKTAAK